MLVRLDLDLDLHLKFNWISISALLKMSLSHKRGHAVEASPSLPLSLLSCAHRQASVSLSLSGREVPSAERSLRPQPGFFASLIFYFFLFFLASDRR